MQQIFLLFCGFFCYFVVNLELHVAIPMLCMTLFLMLYQMVVSISLYLCVLLSVTLLQLGDDSAMICETAQDSNKNKKIPVQVTSVSPCFQFSMTPIRTLFFRGLLLPEKLQWDVKVAAV